MRADAQRNYELLVEHAKLAFAEHGVDASLDGIARSAGVASGTLYRHFPTRLDLVEATLANQIADLAGLGRHLLQPANDPFTALSTWLHATLRHALTYRGLSATLLNTALDQDPQLPSPWHKELLNTTTHLLNRARATKAITTEATTTEILKTVTAIAWATRNTPDQADRLLTLLLNGLRYGSTPAPTGPPK
ncbi:TetR/AcrR family transcriptional regulator [Actinosynnema sp. CA-248983]